MARFPLARNAFKIPSRLSSTGTYLNTTPVTLQYDRLIPPNQNTKSGPLVILHGLFGSRRNWQSLSKAFMRDLARPVYALDLRNHGSSPQASPMTYSSMATDVLHFCDTHSLGGKVAMTLALDPHLPSGLLSNLIVADMTASKGSLSTDFKGYIEGMKKIEASEVSTKKEAHDILTPYELDPSIRDFLLTNLVPPRSAHHHATFRIPLHILDSAISELGSFPYEPGDQTWAGKMLLIKGSRSKYVNRHTIPLTRTFFPNMQLETLETGHWVHAESPNEFKKLVTDFVTL